jgi:two-component system, NarL family, competent response regulator ComA
VNMQNFKVIVVDDHPLMAQASKQLLEQLDNLEVVGVATNGSTCLELVEEHQPDMVFLDVLLPDMSGADVAEKIKDKWPHVQIVIFSGVDLAPLTRRFLELQVSGVISKDTHHETINNIVSCILNGQVVVPRSWMQQLPLAPLPVDVDLTGDEASIMTMLVNGLTLEQIADNIHMSKRSVDNYQRKIYDKLGVNGRAKAIEVFVRSKYYLGQNLAGF